MTGPLNVEKTLKLNFTSIFICFIQTNLHVGKKVETRRHYQDKKKKKKQKRKNTNLKIFLEAWLHMLSFFVLLTHFSNFVTEGWKVENKKQKAHI